MSSVRDYFNQPVSARGGQPTPPKTSFDQSNSNTNSSQNSLLTSAFLGPRLSLNPTINFNGNGAGNQRQVVDTGSVKQNF